MTIKLVRDLMHIGVETYQADTLLVDAVQTLLQNGLESFIVLDGNGHAVGLLSRREAVAAYARAGADPCDVANLTVADVMSPDIPQTPPDIPAPAAAQMMLDWGVRETFLMHHGNGISWPAAVLRFEDVLRYLAAGFKAEVADTGAGGPQESTIKAFF